jgi:hypothetical protein
MTTEPAEPAPATPPIDSADGRVQISLPAKGFASPEARRMLGLGALWLLPIAAYYVILGIFAAGGGFSMPPELFAEVGDMGSLAWTRPVMALMPLPFAVAGGLALVRWIREATGATTVWVTRTTAGWETRTALGVLRGGLPTEKLTDVHVDESGSLRLEFGADDQRPIGDAKGREAEIRAAILPLLPDRAGAGQPDDDETTP